MSCWCSGAGCRSELVDWDKTVEGQLWKVYFGVKSWNGSEAGQVALLVWCRVVVSCRCDRKSVAGWIAENESSSCAARNARAGGDHHHYNEVRPPGWVQSNTRRRGTNQTLNVYLYLFSVCVCVYVFCLTTDPSCFKSFSKAFVELRGDLQRCSSWD